MKFKALKNLIHGRSLVRAGEVIDLPNEKAASMVERAEIEPVKKPEATEPKTPKE